VKPTIDTVCTWAARHICARTQLVQTPTNQDTPLLSRYNLDGDETPVFINLLKYATAAAERGGVPGRDSLLKLCPLIRLLASLHHRTHDNIDEMEALLGCPLALCAPESVWATAQVYRVSHFATSICLMDI
jgi:hypothetical protein